MAAGRHALQQRIRSRFPDRGLWEVCGELAALVDEDSRETEERTDEVDLIVDAAIHRPGDTPRRSARPGDDRSYDPAVAATASTTATALAQTSRGDGRSRSTIVVATHSGPIRAVATTAMGYDPGEPFNTEFVRVRLVAGAKGALVLYRNRVQEVSLPDEDLLPANAEPRFEVTDG